MKKNLVQILNLILVIILFVSCRNSSPEDLKVKRSKEIISGFRAVFTNPPKHVPSFQGVDGPIAGNGDIGVTVSGSPEKQRYWISKNDFWKSGPNYKQSGPSLIGGIDVRIDELKNASFRIEQFIYKPVITSGFSTEENDIKIDMRVLATGNIIVLDINAMKKPVQVQIDLWAKDGFGSKTENGMENGIFWVTRKYNEENLLYPTEAIIALHCSGSTGNSFMVEPGKPSTIVAIVKTNHESAGYQTETLQKMARIDQNILKELRKTHDNWWQQFWAKSFVHIEDTLLEKYYYASHYIMACCSRNNAFPPGLYGNWITMDRLAWSGDIHLNYNHEAPFWALYSSNRLEIADPYDAPLLDLLETFKTNAKKYLNINGAYADVAIGPKGLQCKFPDKPGLDSIYGKFGGKNYDLLAGQPMFLGQKSNAVFASMNMILRYYYTYDEVYTKKVYPFLSAVADFWENYLKYENGRYVIYDDSYGEVGPWEGKEWDKGYGDFNPLVSLGFLKHFFKGMIDINQGMNFESGRIAKWQHIVDNLSAYPVTEINGIKHYRACEGGTGSARDETGLDWNMLHGLVFPATNFGLSSDPVELKMILDDMYNWNDRIWFSHGNAFQTVFIGAARVGYNPDSLIARAKRKIIKDSYPNLWIYAGGGGIETCSGIPGMINEMMLQSHKNIMRIFPVFPSDQRASFYRLRTFGAFLVSSAINKGNVEYLLIESEKGKICKLQNPWKNKKVTLFRNGKLAETLDGAIFSFPTKPGEAVSIVPEGGRNISVEEFLND